MYYLAIYISLIYNVLDSIEKEIPVPSSYLFLIFPPYAVTQLLDTVVLISCNDISPSLNNIGSTPSKPTIVDCCIMF